MSIFPTRILLTTDGSEEAGGTAAAAHLEIGGRPDRRIVQLAEEIDAGLIALGSVSDSVVRHASCPEGAR
jgi:nucleotide-binding universal stress UspA family protein